MLLAIALLAQLASLTPTPDATPSVTLQGSPPMVVTPAPTPTSTCNCVCPDDECTFSWDKVNIANGFSLTCGPTPPLTP